MEINRRQFTGMMLPALAAPLALAVSGRGSGSLAAEAPAKPLVHAIPNDINSLDPADIKGQQDQEIGVNVYERLLDMVFIPATNGPLNADPVAVFPELAESWDVNGPVITFHLRHDVKFYPTCNPITSADGV